MLPRFKHARGSSTNTQACTGDLAVMTSQISPNRCNGTVSCYVLSSSTLPDLYDGDMILSRWDEGPRRESSILGSQLLLVRVASRAIVNRMMIIYQFLPWVYNRMLFFRLASSNSFLFNRSPLCKDRRSWKFLKQLVFKPFATYPRATISIFFRQGSSMRSQLFSNSYVSSPWSDEL